MSLYNERAAARAELLDWAVDKWHSQVKNRPLLNVHRRTLDDTWRQVIRFCGGDDIMLCGSRHDELFDIWKMKIAQQTANNAVTNK